MVITVWEVKRGMVTSIKYDNGKEFKILKIRNPFAIDRCEKLEEFDKAIDIIDKYIVGSVPYLTSGSNIIKNDGDIVFYPSKSRVVLPTKEKKKRTRVDTESILRKLRHEIMVDAPFTIDDIRKIIDIYKDDNNLFYHIEEMIKNGDMKRDSGDYNIYRLIDKDKSKSNSDNKAFKYRKDLYGK